MVYDTKLSTIMTRMVWTVGPSESMERVHEIFEKEPFHHVPVVEDNKLVGIISRSDYDKLCHSFTLFKLKNSEKYNDSLMKSLLAREVMTKDVITLNMNDPVSMAASYFRENLFHAIPIVDNRNDFVGLVTTYDLINYAFMSHDAFDKAAYI